MEPRDQGASSVGAAATDASFFQQFIVIDKNKSLGTPIDTHGEIVVTQDFAAERRIRLERKDFALREARRM